MKLDEQLYCKLKTGKFYDVHTIETFPMYMNHSKNGRYKNVIRYFDECGIMTQEDISKAVYGLQRTAGSGSLITVLKVTDICPITLSDKELKAYCM